MTTLWGDLETYSEVPIKNGTYAYAESAEIMLFTYALDDGEEQCWDLTAGEPMPFDLEMALDDESVLLDFQNAMFDRSVFRLGKNSPDLLRQVGNQIHRWRDTMVKALAHSLPGALEKTGHILNLSEDQQKLKDGKQLVQLFCKPRPVSSKLRRATAKTHPAEWQRFVTYAKGDITSMREVDKRLPSWNYQGVELALWHLDQRINDRGVQIDTEFARAAIDIAEKAKAGLAARTLSLTNGEVESATKRDKLLLHILTEYGVDLPDMQASTLERRVSDPDLPLELRELLDIRLQASMGSTTKYKSMLKAVNQDGRARGLLQFDGAGRTGRWAGRTVQPQNMFRPPKYVKKQWEFAIESIKLGAADLIFDNVMELTAATARGAIIVPQGKKMVVADLANIEGRVQAWLAGEEWKLQAFRDYDAGTGPDLYKLAYANSFGIDAADVDDYMRQIGKVMELMLAYQGGVGAFLTGSLTYGFDLEAMAEKAYSGIPSDTRYQAAEFYKWASKSKANTFGLSERAFIVCDSFKRLWRDAQPNISSLWPELERAAVEATETPSKTFEVRRFKVRRDGGWLRVGLPSGRALCYPQPQVDAKGKLSYMGVNQYNRKWSRINTYGGKIFENACQAVAAHVLKDNMPNIDAQGYEIVLTVHDEVITETPDTDAYNVEGLSALLSATPAWAQGMPLAAAGFEGYRYRKD